MAPNVKDAHILAAMYVECMLYGGQKAHYDAVSQFKHGIVYVCMNHYILAFAFNQ